MPFVHTSAFEPQGELVLWRVDETAHWFIDQLSLASNLWREYHQIAVPAIRLQWLASRFALQQVAKSREMDVHKDIYGKPHLLNDSRFISISHCQGYAAAIAADVAVGVDVERVSSRVQRIKDRFLSPQEQALLGLEDADLMLAWSAKEAVYKMYGSKQLIFKEHIRIVERDHAAQLLRVLLASPEQELQLQLPYCFLDEVVLSWVQQPV
ncbi:MAG: 4'-phosphopantetheinyl transferase superfamily protein [Sphingobacteriaceae bacterium]|nr:4'-phosphopantetheinyl transferase superfamily protein [Sphingobacteriaceae bacterium]